MATTSNPTISVINGPSLDLRGARQPEACGAAPFSAVEALCAATAIRFGLTADCRQSDHEGELIDLVREAKARGSTGIVINPGGYLHTWSGLHDALAEVGIPAVEVHVSNLHARDAFRHQSFTAKAAFATLSGFGIDGYRLAISGLAARIGVMAKA